MKSVGKRTSHHSMDELERANQIKQFESIGMRSPEDDSEWTDPLKKTVIMPLESKSIHNQLRVSPKRRQGSPKASMGGQNSTSSAVPDLSTTSLEPIEFDDGSRPSTRNPSSRPGTGYTTVGENIPHSGHNGSSSRRRRPASSATDAPGTQAFNMPEYLLTGSDSNKQSIKFAPIELHLMSKPREYKDEPTVLELRNYLDGMDRFKSTAFMIWQGKTMRETPEFLSYKDTYSADWGGICTIVESLEVLMQRYDVQLAIVNGVVVHRFAVLGMGSLDEDQLISCCLNSDAVRNATQSMEKANDKNQQFRAAILLQSLLRRWKAMRFFRETREKFFAVRVIQKRYRLHFYKQRLRHRKKMADERSAAKWVENVASCRRMWGSPTEHPSLLILVPAIAADDYIIKANHFYNEMHDVFYPVLHQLARPGCEICIVTPHYMTKFERDMTEKLFSVLCPGGGGKNRISILEERTHFITPELESQTPVARVAVQKISLAEHLWFSPGALRKIKHLSSRHGGAVLVPSCALPIHKKLSIYLNIPLLSADPGVVSEMQTRSYSKRIIMKAGVKTPPGTHDVRSQEDVVTALSRLIAANIDTPLWSIKINQDIQNEGLCMIDPSELKVYSQLKEEMRTLLSMNGGNIGTWFSRPMQLSIRKRISQELIDALGIGHVAHIVRRDVYPTWTHFLRRLKKHGGIIEADAGVMKIGEVVATGFVSPLGDVSLQGAADVILDPSLHTGSGFTYPCRLAPQEIVDGATRAIASTLWSECSFFGFFSVRFCAIFDIYERIPHLWALQVDLGLSPVYNMLGTLKVTVAYTPGYREGYPAALRPSVETTAASGDVGSIAVANIADDKKDDSDDEAADVNAVSMPHVHQHDLFPPIGEQSVTLFPAPMDITLPPETVVPLEKERLRTLTQRPHDPGEHPEGPRAMVYLPIVYHEPLCRFTDEAFLKSCVQRGLIFNRSSRTGVLLLHVGGTKRGTFGIMCFHETKMVAIELMIQALCSIYEFVGKERAVEVSDSDDEGASRAPSRPSDKRSATPTPAPTPASRSGSPSRAVTPGGHGRIPNHGSSNNPPPSNERGAEQQRKKEKHHHMVIQNPPGTSTMRLIRIVGCLKAAFKHEAGIKAATLAH